MQREADIVDSSLEGFRPLLRIETLSILTGRRGVERRYGGAHRRSVDHELRTKLDRIQVEHTVRLLLIALLPLLLRAVGRGVEGHTARFPLREQLLLAAVGVLVVILLGVWRRESGGREGRAGEAVLFAL